MIGHFFVISSSCKSVQSVSQEKDALSYSKAAGDKVARHMYWHATIPEYPSLGTVACRTKCENATVPPVGPSVPADLVSACNRDPEVAVVSQIPKDGPLAFLHSTSLGNSSLAELEVDDTTEQMLDRAFSGTVMGSDRVEVQAPLVGGDRMEVDRNVGLQACSKIASNAPKTVAVEPAKTQQKPINDRESVLDDFSEHVVWACTYGRGPISWATYGCERCCKTVVKPEDELRLKLQGHEKTLVIERCKAGCKVCGKLGKWGMGCTEWGP
ncbi:MAG: hypothetical protein NTV34_13900 [Proteobacteria bacterium]|nr:hypothetical protein [Pseudomonadota bacterium]